MKKKILIIATIAVVIALAAYGTLAWFTDTDSVKNVFVIGSIEIEQHEVFDEQTAQLLPVVDNNDPAASNMIQKEVTVENVGENDAYVQILVAVPAVLDNTGVVHIYDGLTSDNWKKVDGDTETAGIIDPVYTNVTVESETLKYNVYIYRYKTAIAKGFTTDKAIQGVYIDQSVDSDYVEVNGAERYVFTTGDTAKDALLKEFDASGKLNVYVATQAIQADNFASADEALTKGFTTPVPISAQ